MEKNDLLEEIFKLDKKINNSSEDDLAILNDSSEQVSENIVKKEASVDYNDILKEFNKLQTESEEKIPENLEKSENIEELEKSMTIDAIQKEDSEEPEDLSEIGIEELKLDTIDVSESSLDDFFNLDEGSNIETEILQTEELNDEEIKENEIEIEEIVKPEEKNILKEEVEEKKIVVKKTRGPEANIEIQSIINSFLEILLNKNGSSLHINSNGQIVFFLAENVAETEKNDSFNFKNLYTFADYTINKGDFDIFLHKNVFEGIYSYSSEQFHVFYFKHYSEINIIFKRVLKVQNVFEKQILSLPVNKIYNPYKGSINLISGFKEEYAVDFIKVYSTLKTGFNKGLMLIYDRTDFNLGTDKNLFPRVKVNVDNIMNVKNISENSVNNIIFNVELNSINIESIIDAAFVGKNIIVLSRNKNCSRDVIEFLLSKIENRARRRVFIKYLNTSITLNIVKGNGNTVLPVYDFVYFDKKLKRYLIEENFDAFYRELAGNNFENIIPAEVIIEKYVKDGLINSEEAENYIKTFTWSIE